MESAALRRYVTGESDAAERRRVEAWAAESGERRRYLAAMRELYQRGAAEERDEAAAAWARIAARMEPPATPAEKTPAYVAPWEAPAVRVDVRQRRPPRVLAGAFESRRRWPSLIGVAATLLVLIGGGTLVLYNQPEVTAPAAPAVAMRQIATAKGQRAEIQLSDGSRVILGVDSRLRFPEQFGGEARDLHLEGTAYFDVAHDDARPFLVHTANAVTQDIGTKFVVTAYPETGATQVVVTEGAVALGATDTPAAERVVLTEGRLGRLASADSAPTVRTVDPAPYIAWTRGELVFRDAPLSEVVAELRRWYDRDIRLGDPSLGDVPLTASFVVESFQEAVEVVATVAPVRVVREGRTVTLHRR